MKNNYERFFGSPERVAVTFATIEEWLTYKVKKSPVPEDGKEWFAPGAYYLLNETFGTNIGCNAMAVLEWLFSEVK